MAAAKTRMVILGLNEASIETIREKILEEHNEALTEDGISILPASHTNTKDVYVFQIPEPWTSDEWNGLCSKLDILIYVLDSNRDDYEDDKEALLALVDNEVAFKHELPILLYANKQDIPGALAAEDVPRRLGFDTFSSENRDRILVVPLVQAETAFMATIDSWIQTSLTKKTRADKSDKGSKSERASLLDYESRADLI